MKKIALAVAVALLATAGISASQEITNNKDIAQESTQNQSKKSYWQQFKDMFGIKNAAESKQELDPACPLQKHKESPIKLDNEHTDIDANAPSSTGEGVNASAENTQAATQKAMEDAWEQVKKQAQDLYEQAKQIFAKKQISADQTATNQVVAEQTVNDALENQ